MEFDQTRNSGIWSADPKNHTLEPNMKCIGSLDLYLYFDISWSVLLGPHVEGRGGRRGSPIIPLERAMLVSYRLFIVTIALSLTIPPQFTIECLRCSIQQGWVTLCQNFRVFLLEQTRVVWFCGERTNQMKLFSKNSNLCDHDTSMSQTDRWADCQLAIAIPRSA